MVLNINETYDFPPQGCFLGATHSLGAYSNPSPSRPLWQGSGVSLVQPSLGPKAEESQSWGLGPRDAW